MDKLLVSLSQWITDFIANLGYLGIFILMLIENTNLPIPSELIMPLGGYLAATQPERFSVWGMAISGALGSLCGSLLIYWLGSWGGRSLIEKHGPKLLIKPDSLSRAEEWFERYGELAVFFGRMLPMIRTVISLPAGLARMNIARFAVWTFAGSLLWCLLLAQSGKVLGANWSQTMGRYAEHFDLALLTAAVIGLAIHWSRRHRPKG